MKHGIAWTALALALVGCATVSEEPSSEPDRAGGAGGTAALEAPAAPLEALRGAFDDAAETPRFLAVLSPT